VIILDADVILNDYRYKRDPKHAVTHQVLDLMKQAGGALGTMTQGLLEVVGILSFNVPTRLIASLPSALQTHYQLTVFPPTMLVPEYAGCTASEIVTQMQQKMGLGDAVLAEQIRKFAPPGSTLLTWNVVHFRGKVSFPVLSPQEWLDQQAPAGPTP
jgi:hypothetical protein